MVPASLFPRLACLNSEMPSKTSEVLSRQVRPTPARELPPTRLLIELELTRRAPQALKAACWYTVSQVSLHIHFTFDQGTQRRPLDRHRGGCASPRLLQVGLPLMSLAEVALGMPASEHLVGALAELVFTQALALGKDLESFAKCVSHVGARLGRELMRDPQARQQADRRS